MPPNWMYSAYMYWCSFQIKLFNQCAVQIMLITNYKRKMHICYCYHQIFIKTIRDWFLLSFLTSWTVFWSVIKYSVLTCVTHCPISAFILFFFHAVAGIFAVNLFTDYLITMSTLWIFKRNMSTILMNGLPRH